MFTHWTGHVTGEQAGVCSTDWGPTRPGHGEAWAALQEKAQIMIEIKAQADGFKFSAELL